MIPAIAALILAGIALGMSVATLVKLSSRLTALEEQDRLRFVQKQSIDQPVPSVGADAFEPAAAPPSEEDDEFLQHLRDAVAGGEPDAVPADYVEPKPWATAKADYVPPAVEVTVDELPVVDARDPEDDEDTLVPCGDGCGAMIVPVNGKGKPRRFLPGHNARMKP